MEAFVQIQYIILLVVAIVFSILAIHRRTAGLELISSLLWCVAAITNFVLEYSLIGSAISFVWGLFAFVFMGGFIVTLYDSYVDSKHERYQLY